MSTGSDYCVVITTCSNDEEFDTIAAALLDQQLAACIQTTDIKSAYTWKGARQVDPEKLLLIKTRKDLYERVEAAIRQAHTYETPEIICLPIAAGFLGYLNWIDEVTAGAAPPEGVASR